MPLLMNSSTPTFTKCTFSPRSTPLMHMIFLVHVPNSPRNKNMKSGNPYLFQNMVFLASETLLYPLGTCRKNFFFHSEISQSVKNQSLKFGGHVNMKVRSKILRLDVPKKVRTFYNPPCCQQGPF
jgi:hypothetical protein